MSQYHRAHPDEPIVFDVHASAIKQQACGKMGKWVHQAPVRQSLERTREHADQAMKTIGRLAVAIESALLEAEKDPHWGHAGSMAHLSELLAEAHQFITNTSP